MVNNEAARTSVGVLGNVISIILFTSPVPTFVKICKKGSVEEFSPAPYLATFINCCLWVLYGLPMVQTHSLLVVTINGSGMAIELVYLLLFLLYSNRQKRLKVLAVMLLEAVFLGLLAGLVLSLAHTHKVRSLIVGTLASIGNILMYAAPLSIMRMVIVTNSVEFMPFLLSLASLANGICWTAYALIRFDPFIAVPNAMGILLGLGQLILYATFYKSTKRQLWERQQAAKAREINLSGLSKENGNDNSV